MTWQSYEAWHYVQHPKTFYDTEVSELGEGVGGWDEPVLSGCDLVWCPGWKFDMGWPTVALRRWPNGS